MHLANWNRSAAVGCCLAVLMALTAAWSASPARACNTPVFRYAMYNWPSAPYYVFYFHHGEPSEEDAEVNKKLAELSRAELPANVSLDAFDVTDEAKLKMLPKVVNESRKKHADGDKPQHLVYTSWGAELYAGRLDAKTIQQMIHSPARKRMGELFGKGHGMVLLVLTGPDEEANKQAVKVAGEAVSKVDEIFVAGAAPPPMEYLPEKPEEKGDNNGDEQKKDDVEKSDDEKGPKNELKIAVVKVSRTDPAEKWLVKMLLAVEPDLNDAKYAKDPMVYAVYGRGRAMPPYVGKGITTENLLDCMAFLAGACSCTVKDQNPGMDLLMQFDWDAAAEVLARDDPEMADQFFDYQEFPVEEEPKDSGKEEKPKVEGKLEPAKR
ncbi:MAG: hypothetical protein HQ567_17005 [Candidatus Nealsonbacteria bacterium]|nr:hypothetical protein [Candidatus Nealsonbacteria bacterium]